VTPPLRVAHRLFALAVHACLDALAGTAALLLLPVFALMRSRRTSKLIDGRRERLLLGIGALERRRLGAVAVADVASPLPALRPGASKDGPGTRAAAARRSVAEDAATRAESWLVSRAVSGLPLAALVLTLWSFGLALVVFPLYGAAQGVLAYAARFGIGIVILLIAMWLSRSLAARDARLAQRLLGPGESSRLAARVEELIASRASVVEAIDSERRRIERDLHDGVQQQLVALALLLARAKRSAALTVHEVPPADALSGSGLISILDQAHENALQALTELRDVAWRVYPAILDDRGLDAALSALAARSAVPVRIDYQLSRRLPRTVEPVAYFAVSEAVTNAAKHSAADIIHVEIKFLESRAVITVTDNGVGGADPSGAGLSGLARRVAAVEGEMTVTSPVGGPTMIVVELPCGS
jgi:signal transduction histidine kinase